MRVLRRPELILIAASLASLLVYLVARLGWLELAGTVSMGLYPFYAIAAATGWISGNVYVVRSRGSRRGRSRLLLIYLFAPMGLLLLVRAMAPVEDQAQAPLVPLYAAGVLAVLFTVPVTLRPPEPRPPRIGG